MEKKTEQAIPVPTKQFQSVLCVDGCGAPGDPKNNFCCSDCAEERLIREAAKLKHSENPGQLGIEKRKPLAKNLTILRHRKERSTLMKEFYDQPRESDPDMILVELEEFTQQQKTRRVAISQIRKYMIASNRKEDPDPKIWTRYFYNEPGKIVDYAESEQKMTFKDRAENLKNKKDELMIKAVARIQ